MKKLQSILPVLVFLIFLFPRQSVAEPWHRMQLIGSGEYRYLGFIPLYRARYFSDRTAENTNPTDTDRCLVLDYEVEISKEQFTEAAESILRRQLDNRELEHISGQIHQLHQNYRAVSEGDRYSLCYDATAGATTLALNGKALVTIASARFASAYFDIWLGSRQPIDEDLRNNLLGITGGG